MRPQLCLSLSAYLPRQRFRRWLAVCSCLKSMVLGKTLIITRSVCEGFRGHSLTLRVGIGGPGLICVPVLQWLGHLAKNALGIDA